MTGRYLAVSRRLLAEQGPALAALAGAPAGPPGGAVGKNPRRRRCARGHGGDRHDLFRAITQAALQAPWCGNIGLMFSTGTMEHYTPEQLEEWIAMVKQAHAAGWRAQPCDGPPRPPLARGQVDCPRCLQYTLSEAEFRQVMGNTLDYHNRWLQERLGPLFRVGTDTQVETRTVIPNTPDLVQIDHGLLAPAYRHADESDLALTRHPLHGPLAVARISHTFCMRVPTHWHSCLCGRADLTDCLSAKHVSGGMHKERRSMSAVPMESQSTARSLIPLSPHGRGRTRFAPPWL